MNNDVDIEMKRNYLNQTSLLLRGIKATNIYIIAHDIKTKIKSKKPSSSYSFLMWSPIDIIYQISYQKGNFL